MAIDFQRVQGVFQAVAHLPPAERAAVLERECSDDAELRRRVEALLKAHDDSGELPAASWPATRATPCPKAPDDPGESPAAEPGPTGPHVPAVEPGQLFAGRYKLREKLGAGGMGVVFVAEQTGPVQRRVALKVIRAGLDTHRLLARFEQERQALALMDHPNIAKVFDAGVDPGGRPYFAMELIKGLPLTRYCDDAKLSPRQRLELFVPVCQAVQHAHHKGVIHRDLKPSNILVGLYDGVPVPKVIDFGVAKATGPRLTERSVYTEVGSIIGTLEYMSPEQAELNNLDIDTRSDVYALGVVLYELLTGAVPFSRKELEGAGLAEMLRVIKEVEPPKPSTKLSHSGSLPSVAAQRHMEPRKLTALVRGELDWIVMKALEKDRGRRYETANGFAMDVQRYLADEPVQAGPPSAGYRLRKLLKRHRGPVLAAVLVLAALVTGIVGLTVGLVEAEQARQDETQQRQAAVTNAAKAKDEAGKAKRAREKAQRLAKDEKAARDRAEKQLLRAEWLLYASQINLAQQAWENNNGFLAFHHLESCRRDFRGWEHDYLVMLFHRGQRTLRGHTGEVTSVALSRDGKRAVTGSADGTVKVWDTATGNVTRTLKRNALRVNTGAVYCVALSPNGRRLVSGNWDTMGESMTVWDLDKGERVAARTGDLSGTLSVALSPDGTRVVCGNMAGAVTIRDAATLRETLSLRAAGAVAQPNVWGQGKAVCSLAISPDAKQVVGCDHDRTIKIWDAANGKQTRTLRGHTDGLTSVAVSPDGRHIVSGSMDRAVKVWDAVTGREIRTLKGHTGTVSGVAVSADGRRIVSSSYDGTARVWDAETGQEIRTLVGHTAEVTSVAVSRDGTRVVSGSRDKTVKVWDAAAPPEPQTWRAGMFAVVAVSADGRRVVTGGMDGAVQVWDATTGRQTLAVKRHTANVAVVAVSADGTRIVSGSWDRTAKVWDAATGREIRALKGHTGQVMSVAPSRDGRRVVSVSMDGVVKVWDAAGGEKTQLLKGYVSRPTPPSRIQVQHVVLSPDGKRVLGGSNDGTVQVWDAATGAELLTLRGHTDMIAALAMSPDGKRIITGSNDKTVKVWDAATGNELLTLNGHTNAVSGVVVSPDGKRIFTASGDKTVKVWDAATGHETFTLRGQATGVSGLALSADGRRLVSVEFDGTVKTWDAGKSQQQP
jgi:WD40 repeat protein